jgi:hypothetical protein
MSSRTSSRPSTTAVPALRDRPTTWLDRFAPLGGVVFALMAAVGYLTIDEYPDSQTPVSELTGYYAAHHAQIGRGGLWIAYSVIFFVLFGGSIWARIRRSAAPPLLGAVALVAVALFAANLLNGADGYAILGQLGDKDTTTPGALQAVHMSVTAGAPAITMTLILLVVSAAAFMGRAFPRWLAGAALALIVLQFTPASFVAWMLFHLWVLVAGITMAVRPAPAPQPATIASTDAPSGAAPVHG